MVSTLTHMYENFNYNVIFKDVVNVLEYCPPIFHFLSSEPAFTSQCGTQRGEMGKFSLPKQKRLYFYRIFGLTNGALDPPLVASRIKFWSNIHSCTNIIKLKISNQQPDRNRSSIMKYVQRDLESQYLFRIATLI